VCRAAAGHAVLEFGLRRAQGIDGGLAASRAAFIGGCAATSNVLAGKLFGIPVRGTHAHSWIMAFPEERAAFAAYAQALPHNCIFLVDTYDTLTGVQAAIQVAREMQSQDCPLLGIRLDSGDFAALSREARALLDAAGFPAAAIIASGDLDEYEIQRLRQAGAAINVWGVGTRLATAYDQPALGGVYKLAALRAADGSWDYKVKLSEDGTKMSGPGVLQVRRLVDATGRFLGDVIYDELIGIAQPASVVPFDQDQAVTPVAVDGHRDLLVPVFRRGRAVYTPPTAAEARVESQRQLAALDDTVLRLDQPQPYLVGMEPRLHQLKADLIAQRR
jgi:nicotinate phosphoribosyltransferase